MPAIEKIEGYFSELPLKIFGKPYSETHAESIRPIDSVEGRETLNEFLFRRISYALDDAEIYVKVIKQFRDDYDEIDKFYQYLFSKTKNRFIIEAYAFVAHIAWSLNIEYQEKLKTKTLLSGEKIFLTESNQLALSYARVIALFFRPDFINILAAFNEQRVKHLILYMEPCGKEGRPPCFYRGIIPPQSIQDCVKLIEGHPKSIQKIELCRDLLFALGNGIPLEWQYEENDVALLTQYLKDLENNRADLLRTERGTQSSDQKNSKIKWEGTQTELVFLMDSLKEANYISKDTTDRQIIEAFDFGSASMNPEKTYSNTRGKINRHENKPKHDKLKTLIRIIKSALP